MKPIFVLIIYAVMFVLFVLFCMMPNNKRRDRLKPYKNLYIAHRGLHNNKIPENSIAAFLNAIKHGCGIELDVQQTKDGHIVVFHDETLKRMFGIDKRLNSFVYDNLAKLKLPNSNESIPTFEKVLKVVRGAVPLVIEIKHSKEWKSTCQKVAKIMDKYKGEFCIESFNPFVEWWFKKNRPNVLRGQLATNTRKESCDVPRFVAFMLSNLIPNFFSRPDFIAYDIKYKNHFGFWICRKIFHAECFYWVIRDEKIMEKEISLGNATICEGFSP